jgi:prepilin peptidase CpaA
MVSFFQFASVLVFPVAVAYAAASDLLTMTIPNRISLAMVAGFFVAAAATGLGWEAAGWHLAIGVGVLAGTFTMFALGWIGGGDAKLAAVTALWMGPAASMPFLVYTALLGGLLASVFVGFRRLPLPVFAAREDWIQRLHAPENGVPYGIALAGGALMAFPETPWFDTLAAFAVR